MRVESLRIITQAVMYVVLLLLTSVINKCHSTIIIKFIDLFHLLVQKHYFYSVNPL